MVEISDLFEQQCGCSLLIDLTRHFVFNKSESASNHAHFWTFVPRLLHSSSSESSLVDPRGSLFRPMFQRCGTMKASAIVSIPSTASNLATSSLLHPGES